MGKALNGGAFIPLVAEDSSSRKAVKNWVVNGTGIVEAKASVLLLFASTCKAPGLTGHHSRFLGVSTEMIISIIIIISSSSSSSISRVLCIEGLWY